MKVDEIMTRDVLTIGPDAEVRDIARILVENHISGLPVCGIQREVLGVISEGDILYKEHDPRPIRRNRLRATLRPQAPVDGSQGRRSHRRRGNDSARDHDSFLLLGLRGSALDVRARRKPAAGPRGG